MRASVIMPAKDAERTIARSLAALARQDLADGFEIIVVNDGSGDRTAELAQLAEGPITVLHQSAAGPGAARNLGAAHARAELLAFCDADVFPTSSWLRSGLAALERADLVQGMVLPDPEASLGPFDRTIWVTGPGGLWESANLFVRRELFQRLGGFEDGVGPSGAKPMAEDVFLGYAALRSGAVCRFCPEALAYHAVFQREWRGYVAERQRLAYFPAMARRQPELRRRFLHRRIFLNSRSAWLDVALLGAAWSLARRAPLPLLIAGPYLNQVRKHSERARTAHVSRTATAAVDVAADLVGLGAMLTGSLRHRSPVL